MSQLFKDEVDPNTGEHSLKENIVPRELATYCKQGEHYFELENPRSRDLVCKKCGQGASFVLGIHKLVDGKVIENAI